MSTSRAVAIPMIAAALIVAACVEDNDNANGTEDTQDTARLTSSDADNRTSPPSTPSQTPADCAHWSTLDVPTALSSLSLVALLTQLHVELLLLKTALADDPDTSPETLTCSAERLAQLRLAIEQRPTDWPSDDYDGLTPPTPLFNDLYELETALYHADRATLQSTVDQRLSDVETAFSDVWNQLPTPCPNDPSTSRDLTRWRILMTASQLEAAVGRTCAAWDCRGGHVPLPLNDPERIATLNRALHESDVALRLINTLHSDIAFSPPAAQTAALNDARLAMTSLLQIQRSINTAIPHGNPDPNANIVGPDNAAAAIHTYRLTIAAGFFDPSAQ